MDEYIILAFYMYWFLVLVLFLVLFLLNRKEGFDSNLERMLHIYVSDDLQEISVPNTIQGDMQFSGNVFAPALNATTLNAEFANLQRLNVENTTLNTVTLEQTKVEGSNLLELGADTGKSWDGNGSISYKTSWDTNALNIVGAENGGPRKVHLWDDVVIDGNLDLTGNMTIFGSGQKWSFTVRDNGWIDILHNDTSPDNYGANVGHVILSSDGNLWLARSSYPGWIADNEQAVSKHRDDVNAEREREREEAERKRKEDLLKKAEAIAARTAQSAASIASRAGRSIRRWFSSW